ALLALFLLLEQLLLTADVTAIALGQYVLAQCFYCAAGNDLSTDGSLNGHIIELARNQFLHFLGEHASFRLRLIAMHDECESVDRITVDEDVETYQLRAFKTYELIVERGVTAAY